MRQIFFLSLSKEFYVFQDTDPSEAPVVIWLQGGPGSSSLFGLLELHGPFKADYVFPTIDNQNDGPVKAVMNTYAWSKKANMIYIDNPVGAGILYFKFWVRENYSKCCKIKFKLT